MRRRGSGVEGFPRKRTFEAVRSKRTPNDRRQSGAVKYISSGRPSAVIVTTAGLLDEIRVQSSPENDSLVDVVRRYTVTGSPRFASVSGSEIED